MELIGFIAFFALVVAWIVAPNGDVEMLPKAAAPVAPKLTPGDAIA